MRQAGYELLIAAARQSAEVLGVGGLPTRSALSLESDAAAVAFDVHLEDGGVVDEPVDRGERHGGVREDLAPFSKGLVGRDQDGTTLVAGADQLEQDACFGLVLGDVGEVVEDQEVEAVEPVEGGFEGELAAGDLELLDEIGGPREEDLPAVLDEREADGRGQVALSSARRPEEEQVGARGEPGVAGSDRHASRGK